MAVQSQPVKRPFGSKFQLRVNSSIFSRTSLKRLVKVVLTASVVGILTINSMAWMHARAMTHFVDAGDRTAKPETLSFPQKAWTLLTGVNIPKPRNVSSPTDYGLLYETHLIRELNGVSLEAWFVPNPEQRALVIMFHGYAACKSDLIVPAAKFHSMGFEVLLVDFHGSGGSSVVRQTVDNLFSLARARFTFSRMSDALAVHMKDFGSTL